MGAKPLATQRARWATVAALEDDFEGELLWLAQAIIDRDRAMERTDGGLARQAWRDAESALHWDDADPAFRVARLPDLVATALMNLVEEHHGPRRRRAEQTLVRVVKRMRGGRPREEKQSQPVPLSKLVPRRSGRPRAHPKIKAKDLIAAAGSRKTIREGLKDLAASTLRAEGKRATGRNLEARLRNFEEQYRAARPEKQHRAARKPR